MHLDRYAVGPMHVYKLVVKKQSHMKCAQRHVTPYSVITLKTMCVTTIRWHELSCPVCCLRKEGSSARCIRTTFRANSC